MNVHFSSKTDLHATPQDFLIDYMLFADDSNLETQKTARRFLGPL
jgi:hypothetical protein